MQQLLLCPVILQVCSARGPFSDNGGEGEGGRELISSLIARNGLASLKQAQSKVGQKPSRCLEQGRKRRVKCHHVNQPGKTETKALKSGYRDLLPVLIHTMNTPYAF